MLRILELWQRRSRRVNTTMGRSSGRISSSSRWRLNSERYSNCGRSWQASAARRESALQADLADLSDFWHMNAAVAETGDPVPAAPRYRRSFIGSRAFSKLVRFDSQAASWKDWALKFENVVAAVVTSSRDTPVWAAQQETPC